MVNEKINEGMEVRTDIMTVDEAKKTGAMALFGEKYGEKSVSFPWESSPGSSVAVHM